MVLHDIEQCKYNAGISTKFGRKTEHSLGVNTGERKSMTLEATRANKAIFERTEGIECMSANDKNEKVLLLVGQLAGTKHESAAGTMAMSITECMRKFGQSRMLIHRASPRTKIGSRVKEPDMTIRPRGTNIGNGVLGDGFGYPFPNLVIEVANSELSVQLLEELELWISPETSVQVAIGIKIHMEKGCTVDGDVKSMEAILYRRRSVLNPTQWVRFYPVGPNAYPVLRVHLADLYFGVPLHLIPNELKHLVERNSQETIELDLDWVREIILETMPRTLEEI
jgi:hypothetical protein